MMGRALGNAPKARTHLGCGPPRSGATGSGAVGDRRAARGRVGQLQSCRARVEVHGSAVRFRRSWRRLPKGDYNGRNRGGPNGVVSLTQYTMRDGRRSSTYQAFLAGEPEQRPNLTIITGARATRVLLDVTDGQTIATGVEYCTAGGETVRVHAAKEVILSAGVVGSLQCCRCPGSVRARSWTPSASLVSSTRRISANI